MKIFKYADCMDSWKLSSGLLYRDSEAKFYVVYSRMNRHLGCKNTLVFSPFSSEMGTRWLSMDEGSHSKRRTRG